MLDAYNHVVPPVTLKPALRTVWCLATPRKASLICLLLGYPVGFGFLSSGPRPVSRPNGDASAFPFLPEDTKNVVRAKKVTRLSVEEYLRIRRVIILSLDNRFATAQTDDQTSYFITTANFIERGTVKPQPRTSAKQLEHTEDTRHRIVSSIKKSKIWKTQNPFQINVHGACYDANAGSRAVKLRE